MRILVAGGGTGGHLYPGIAVAQEIKARRPDAEVVFVGTAHGIESQVIPREGFPLAVIRSRGLKGKSLIEIFYGLILLPFSVLDAWRVLSVWSPEVVIGVGGYSSGPVVLLASFRGISTLLLEQNAMPGFTNRLLAWVVDVVAVTYKESARFFRGKAFIAGNPVRSQFHQWTENISATANAALKETRVLIFGGSQGAHTINLAMVAAASYLAGATTKMIVTHQTGERDLEMVREGYRRAGLLVRVEAFLFDIDKEMKNSDLIVCRAGATTIAEIAALARPAILIPLPTATDDHQRKNALALENIGAARLLEQQGLSGERLASEIIDLCIDTTARIKMSKVVKIFSRPDAARLIVDRVFSLIASR